MNGEVNYSLVLHEQGRNWECFCIRCRASLGQWTMAQVNKVVYELRNRGGILCPDCRVNTCPKCFTQSYKGTVCSLCELEQEIIKDVTSPRLSIYP